MGIIGPYYVRFPSIWLPFGPLGLQWQPFGGHWVYQLGGPIKLSDHIMLDFPPYGCQFAHWRYKAAVWVASLMVASLMVASLMVATLMVASLMVASLMVGSLMVPTLMVARLIDVTLIDARLIDVMLMVASLIEGGAEEEVTGWLLKTRTHLRRVVGKNKHVNISE